MKAFHITCKAWADLYLHLDHLTPLRHGSMHHARTPLALQLGPQRQTIRHGGCTVALGARV